MQEIKKSRIVLASVLKPANEPRMFDKIGRTLAKKYEVYCIGAPSGIIIGSSNPVVLELTHVKRLSFFRLLVPFTVLNKVIKVRPSLLIICTHDLLFMSLLARLITRCKVVYDVQENYYRNIRYGTSFPIIIREMIAAYVRMKERISSVFVDHYFLAEKAYEEEITFFGSKKTVLENKVADASISPRTKAINRDGRFNFLFSGTLAETTGVFLAIDIVKKLHGVDQKVRLTIIGFSADSKTIELIEHQIKDHEFIQLKGGHSIVPHDEIVSAIRSSDVGIISYPPNPSTANAIPTKLFEYLAYSLPILLIDNPRWMQVCEPYNAAVSFNPETFSAATILKALNEQTFYTSPPSDVFWTSEEKKLLQTIETIGI